VLGIRLKNIYKYDYQFFFVDKKKNVVNFNIEITSIKIQLNIYIMKTNTFFETKKHDMGLVCYTLTGKKIHYLLIQ
jgi:hypothetical protein